MLLRNQNIRDYSFKEDIKKWIVTKYIDILRLQ
jgi:hypothetical protein